MKYKLVVCGGTFDHFHRGHRSLLKLAFSLGNKVVIGVTSDIYVQNSKFKIQNSKFIEPFVERKEAVLEFIKSKGVLNRAEIVKIDDLFGSTLDRNLQIDAIVISRNTMKGAELINKKRKDLGLSILKVLVCPFVRSQDQKIISSTRIKKGEIDREGKAYVNPLWFEKNLKLPEKLRKELQKPFGKLLIRDKDLFRNKDSLVITVGDVTSKVFNEKSLGQNISVIDFRVARKEKFSNILELGFTGNEKIFKTDNKAGYITSNLFKKLIQIFKSDIKDKVILQVNGEEDLAVLPLVLLSPLDSIIYYGQPSKGIVRIEVSEEIKKTVYKLVDRFEM